MRVCVCGDDVDGAAVGGDRVGQAAHFVEHVAEVEESQGVARVGVGGATIHLLGLGEIAAVVEDRSEVDARGRVVLLAQQDGFIKADGVVERVRRLLELHGADEHGLERRGFFAVGLADTAAA